MVHFGAHRVAGSIIPPKIDTSQKKPTIKGLGPRSGGPASTQNKTKLTGKHVLGPQNTTHPDQTGKVGDPKPSLTKSLSQVFRSPSFKNLRSISRTSTAILHSSSTLEKDVKETKHLSKHERAQELARIRDNPSLTRLEKADAILKLSPKAEGKMKQFFSKGSHAKKLALIQKHEGWNGVKAAAKRGEISGDDLRKLDQFRNKWVKMVESSANQVLEDCGKDQLSFFAGGTEGANSDIDVVISLAKPAKHREANTQLGKDLMDLMSMAASGPATGVPGCDEKNQVMTSGNFADTEFYFGHAGKNYGSYEQLKTPQGRAEYQRISLQGSFQQFLNAEHDSKKVDARVDSLANNHKEAAMAIATGQGKPKKEIEELGNRAYNSVKKLCQETRQMVEGHEIGVRRTYLVDFGGKASTEVESMTDTEVLEATKDVNTSSTEMTASRHKYREPHLKSWAQAQDSISDKIDSITGLLTEQNPSSLKYQSLMRERDTLINERAGLAMMKELFQDEGYYTEGALIDVCLAGGGQGDAKAIAKQAASSYGTDGNTLILGMRRKGTSKPQRSVGQILKGFAQGKLDHITDKEFEGLVSAHINNSGFNKGTRQLDSLLSSIMNGTVKVAYELESERSADAILEQWSLGEGGKFVTSKELEKLQVAEKKGELNGLEQEIMKQFHSGKVTTAQGGQVLGKVSTPMQLLESIHENIAMNIHKIHSFPDPSRALIEASKYAVRIHGAMSALLDEAEALAKASDDEEAQNKVQLARSDLRKQAKLANRHLKAKRKTTLSLENFREQLGASHMAGFNDQKKQALFSHLKEVRGQWKADPEAMHPMARLEQVTLKLASWNPPIEGIEEQGEGSEAKLVITNPQLRAIVNAFCGITADHLQGKEHQDDRQNLDVLMGRLYKIEQERMGGDTTAKKNLTKFLGDMLTLENTVAQITLVAHASKEEGADKIPPPSNNGISFGTLMESYQAKPGTASSQVLDKSNTAQNLSGTVIENQWQAGLIQQRIQ